MRIEQADPKGLIRESYRIEGITAPDCRSIFLDWALSLPQGSDTSLALKRVIAEYGADEDHPMTAILKEGLTRSGPAVRRGGRKARLER